MIEKILALSVLFPEGVKARVSEHVLDGSTVKVVAKFAIHVPPGKGKETAAALRELAAEVEGI